MYNLKVIPKFDSYSKAQVFERKLSRVDKIEKIDYYLNFGISLDTKSEKTLYDVVNLLIPELTENEFYEILSTRVNSGLIDINDTKLEIISY